MLKTNSIHKYRLQWIFLFLLGSFCSVQIALAQAKADQHLITYECTNEKLSVALKKVERLSNYYKIQFAFDDVDPYHVTVNLKNVTVNKAVQELLKNTRLTFDGN